MEPERFHLFWGGPFSQWTEVAIEIDGVVYNTCEQYMMAEKARLFNDQECLDKIMSTRDPREQKRIGRKVRGFDKAKWEEVQENGKPYCWNVVYKANHAKFTQNKGMKFALMETGDKVIVEASPYDAIWGIALAEDDPRANDRASWKGANWLGEAITQVREDIRKEEEEK